MTKRVCITSTGSSFVAFEKTGKQAVKTRLNVGIRPVKPGGAEGPTVTCQKFLLPLMLTSRWINQKHLGQIRIHSCRGAGISRGGRESFGIDPSL